VTPRVSGDVRGRVCVVTGASSGIGTETAVALAAGGADVVLVGRDGGRLAAAAARARSEGPQSTVTTHRADLASMDGVRALAAELTATLPRISVLVNNAGIVPGPRRERTRDGYETTFAVNHLAPYLLTRLLAGRLTTSAPARVVTVASDAYKGGRIRFDDLMGAGRWHPAMAYAQSKLANALFSHELAKRLAGSDVTSNAVHPGLVATGLGRHHRLFGAGMAVLQPFLSSPGQGATTSVHVASAPVGGQVTGGYWAAKRVVSVHDKAADDDAARRLWEVSAELVGLSPGGVAG
jgi:NAD(P)-dependent dehydrogenase (short-subunit alcohol dehydrogenase family)